MAQLRAEAEQRFANRADELFAIIADYPGRHRRLMPAAYHDYAATADPAGTTVHWVLHVGRHRRPYDMQVTTNAGDRTVVERDRHSSFTTEWRVTTAENGSRVRLASTWQQRSTGFPALFERLFAPRSLGRLHAESLRLLAAEAAPPG
jgi:hypothetical protein